MNCDLVFDILTRGPFPSGQPSDSQVERHLAGCHECRQLAEALRPAVELFHESLAEEECAGLPHYQGRLASAEMSRLPTLIEAAICDTQIPAFEQVAVPTQPSAPRQESSRAVDRLTPFKAMACAAALVLLCGAVSWAVMSSLPQPSTAPSMSTKAPRLTGASLLATLSLPTACLAQETSETVRDSANRQCCTGCHSADRPGVLAAEQVAVLHQACRACHLFE